MWREQLDRMLSHILLGVLRIYPQGPRKTDTGLSAQQHRENSEQDQLSLELCFKNTFPLSAHVMQDVSLFNNTR